jgi:mannan polymerase II complex MNN10 subunit
MSLSRSPSPRRGGGWSSPALTTTPYGNGNGNSSNSSNNGSARRPSPMRDSAAHGGPGNVRWTAAQSRGANKASTFAPLAQGIGRHFRKVSGRLPIFSSKDYSDKEKLGRGRWSTSTPTLRTKDVLPFIGRIFWKARLFITIVVTTLIFIFFILGREYLIFYSFLNC